jgi:HEAT repeat protein
MHRRTIVALCLMGSCEAPRAGNTVPVPEVVAAQQSAPAVEAAPAATAPDQTLRARLEQMLGGTDLPDAPTLKSLGSGTLDAVASIADDEEVPIEVRARALASLPRLGDPRASAVLLRALQSGRSPLLLHTALFALARAGGAAAVPRIAPFLADDSPTMRLAAAEALGRFGGPGARPLLQRRLPLETDSAVRDALARAIDKSNL